MNYKMGAALHVVVAFALISGQGGNAKTLFSASN